MVTSAQAAALTLAMARAQAVADTLKAAGVPVTTRKFPGQFHGFFTMGKVLPQANVAAREIGARPRGGIAARAAGQDPEI